MTPQTKEAAGKRTGSEPVDISVVIVTWNSLKYIRECLTTVDAGRGSLSMEVIVVDNASSDGTQEVVRREYPWACLIDSGDNLGFARGNNLGIAHSHGKYLALVNSDVNVPKDCFTSLFRFMENNADIGMAGPQLIDGNGNPGRSTMKFLTLWNVFCRAIVLDRLPFARRLFGGFLMADLRANAPLDVDVLNGWFWMLRRSAVAEVGVLDHRFFMYGEDIDWSHRFHQGGWRVVLYPGAQAVHYGGGSSERTPVRLAVEREKANLQYWRKFHGRASTLLYRALCSLNVFVRWAGFSVASLLARSSRDIVAIKRKRSAACLQWLITSKYVNEEK